MSPKCSAKQPQLMIVYCKLINAYPVCPCRYSGYNISWSCCISMKKKKKLILFQSKAALEDGKEFVLYRNVKRLTKISELNEARHVADCLFVPEPQVNSPGNDIQYIDTTTPANYFEMFSTCSRLGCHCSEETYAGGNFHEIVYS